MLSDHNHKITLDKYTFALEYDDEFDMSEIEVQQVDEVFTLFSGEFSLDEGEMDAPMPGLLVKLTLTRIVSYFIVQVAETLAYCFFLLLHPTNLRYVLSHAALHPVCPLRPRCLHHPLHASLGSCGQEWRPGWVFISHFDLVLMFALLR